MKKESSSFLLKISVLSISFLSLAFVLISPAMADIAKSFPNASPSLLQAIINVPTLVAIPFILFGGAISNRIQKKTLIIIALVIFTVSGISPFFLNDIIAILIARCIFGLGFGLMLPYSQGLIADFFRGTPDYQAMLGYQSAVTNGGSILLSMAAGFLCLAGWHNVFLAYLSGAVILLIVIFLLPEPPKNHHGQGKSSAKLPKVVYYYVFGTFLYAFFMIPVLSNTSFLIADGNMGNASVSALVLTVHAAGGCLGGFVFGWLVKIFKRKTIAVSLLIHGAAMLSMAFATHSAVVVIGGLICGFAFATVIPSIMSGVGRESKGAATLGFAYTIVAINLGNFVSGLVMPPIIQAIAGGSGLGKSEFIFGGLGMLVCSVVCLLLFSIRPKENPEVTPA